MVGKAAGWAVALVVALSLPPSLGSAATLQTFDADGQGSRYTPGQLGLPPGPALVPGGPTRSGRFLRLAEAIRGVQNSVTFDRSDPGAFGQVIVDFDFRVTPRAGRADGFGMALLSTARYGLTGTPPLASPAEEPNFLGSLGIGVDVYRSPPTAGNPDGDLGDPGFDETFTNSLSIHYDGVLIAGGQVDVSRVVDLAAGRWIHAQVIVRAADTPPTVTVMLTPCETSPPVTVLDRMPVPGLRPYEARLHFAARTGGLAADQDLDNVSVRFMDQGQSLVSLAAPRYHVLEGTNAVVAITRAGDLSKSVSVRVSTADASARAGRNYAPRAGTVMFRPGETIRHVTIPTLNDRAASLDRTFTVTLSRPLGPVVVGGAGTTLVVIADLEQARAVGWWEPAICLPIVPIHLHLLPTRKVMFWDRLGNSRTWDPDTRVVSNTSRPAPDYDAFCSGHSFLPDGTLLVTGGHNDAEGSPDHDGEGIETAAIYDPFDDAWTTLPPMSGGRWYPTNVALDNGDVLVVSGSVTTGYDKNTLPQVWQSALGSWRDLTQAQAQQLAFPPPGPLGVDLYPRMLLAPDGRAFKAGPDADTWFLATTGAGDWTAGPPTRFTGIRTYGTATTYGPGQYVVTGGGGGDVFDPGELPTSTVEVLDLNDPPPQAWRSVSPMAGPRRQHNATMLPDGTLLVTGGSRAAGFGGGAYVDVLDQRDADPVFEAELWSPDTESWTTLAAMEVPRLYHSTAILLPDGRVLSAGGGQGAGAASFQSNAEIYWPPYLFRGGRPAIRAVPSTVRHGATVVIVTPDASRIDRVTLVRLPSVTHSFDQNQGFVTLEAIPAGGSVRVRMPAESTVLPPGHYLLFLVNRMGVPSIARVVRVTS